MSEYPDAIPVERINTSLREQTGEWRGIPRAGFRRHTLE